VTTKDVVITSARAGELEAALDAAINKVEAAKMNANDMEAAREKAEQQLKGRIRLVAEELAFKLDDMDSRWPAYGLDKPGETQRPAAVTGVVVTLPSPRHVHLAWPPSDRAVRYKVRGRVIGKDAEPSTLAEVFEEQADFTTFAPGDVVTFEIVAVNIAGDSAPSEQVSVTLPLTPFTRETCQRPTPQRTRSSVCAPRIWNQGKADSGQERAGRFAPARRTPQRGVPTATFQTNLQDKTAAVFYKLF
jgi:hypothetical protein